MTITAPEARLFDGFQLRDIETTDNLTFIEARAVPYGVQADVGWYLEDHAQGSLGKSIKEAARDLPLLLFHDNRSFPIGAADEWREAKDGLYGVWRLDGSAEAQRAAKQAKDGFLSYMSIGFNPIRSTWTMVDDWDPDRGPEHKDRVTRLESRLLEVSLVSTPAFKDATVNLVRSADARMRGAQRGARPALTAWRAELERMRA